jgi:hypothetical protein
LNRLFKCYGILVREAFTLAGDDGEGIVAQIDGVIELEGATYVVEMKWYAEPLGVKDVAQHQVRVFYRGNARGVIISASDFTAPAVTNIRESLSQITVVLCTLEEFVRLLDQQGDLRSMLKSKVNAAIVEKNPFLRYTAA